MTTRNSLQLTPVVPNPIEKSADFCEICIVFKSRFATRQVSTLAFAQVDGIVLQTPKNRRAKNYTDLAKAYTLLARGWHSVIGCVNAGRQATVRRCPGAARPSGRSRQVLRSRLGREGRCPQQQRHRRARPCRSLWPPSSFESSCDAGQTRHR